MQQSEQKLEESSYFEFENIVQTPTFFDNYGAIMNNLTALKFFPGGIPLFLRVQCTVKRGGDEDFVSKFAQGEGGDT